MALAPLAGPAPPMPPSRPAASPRLSCAVWRLVLQLVRRDAALCARLRAAGPDLDTVHAALQVGRVRGLGDTALRIQQ